MSDELFAGKLRVKRKRFFRDLKWAIIVVLIILVFRSSFWGPFRIPTGSMSPTLLIGDFILVNKFAYGWKVPFTDLSVFKENIGPIYLWENEGPKRGDVVVFKYPKDYRIFYVKRVVGLPGETIEIKNKTIYINERPLKMSELSLSTPPIELDEKSKNYNLKYYQAETGNHQHMILHDNDNYYQVDFDKVIIPADHYFVIGDNRDFSYDSRYWGPVPRKNISGKAVLIWLSMILPVADNPFAFRSERIFKKID